MTIQEAIQKAIEGGWETKNCSNCLEPWIGHKQTRIGNRYCTILPDMNKAFLDPLFWQALGKGVGWVNKEYPKGEMRCDNPLGRCEDRFCSYGGFRDPVNVWHSFIDHLADSKTPEDFFKQF